MSHAFTAGPIHDFCDHHNKEGYCGRSKAHAMHAAPLAYDYTNQAWLRDGVYVSCGHSAAMNCGCFGRIHAGESPAANAEIH